MQTSSRNLLIAAAVLALALVGYFLIFPAQPSDREQLLTQLDALRTAGEHRNVSGIMKEVSADYKDPLMDNVDQLHAFLIRTVGQSKDVHVQTAFSPPMIDVHGDTATTKTHLHVTTATGDETLWDHDVTLTWKREDGTRLLVIPTKVWRITSADYGSVGGGSSDFGL